MGEPDAAASREIAVYRVPRHQVIKEVRGALGGLVTAVAEVGAELPLQRLSLQFQSRQHLSSVATGSAPAGPVAIDDYGLDPARGQMQRGGEPGITCADDCDLGGAPTGQPVERRAWRSCRGPERRRVWRLCLARDRP